MSPKTPPLFAASLRAARSTRLLFIAGAFCALQLLLTEGRASVTASDADLLLNTRNTTLALHRSGNSWLVLHYGSRLEQAADANTLAWSPWFGSNTLGNRKPVAYSVVGDETWENKPNSVNKYGGLAVIHADGVASTELQAVGAPTVQEVQPGISHVTIKMKDPAYAFTLTQHFRVVEASDVLETWVEIQHQEAGPIKLVRMNSLALTLPSLAREFSLLSMTGQWASENQLVETPLGLGQTITLGSRSGVRSAFGDNASFMLSVGAPATETSGRVLGGALAWSGAWEISVQRDQANTLAINAGPDTATGPYTLDPGKTLVTPKMALTYSSTGKGQVSRNFHRWARDVQLRDGHAPREVLLNSWEGAYFNFTEQTLTDMMDGTKELGGEMFVVDDGWFGRGKYARNDDKRGLGDWVVNDAKLPRGLGWLAGEAGKRGLKFGIWVEPEMANTTSELVEQHPDWVLREKTRTLRQGRGNTQVVLDLTNPAVRDNLFRQLDSMVTATPGLAYIKWDANADFMNLGSAYLTADRQPNLWFDYTAGLYELLAQLQAKYPGMAIQGCASGGGRMDYGFLRYADEFWTSDNTDARQRIFMQWGAGHFYPACAMAAHVTAVPNHQTHRSTPLKFRFDVAMSGRLGFELHPKGMTPEELVFAKQAVEDYKRIRPVVQQGDLYRLVSPLENSYASLMYVSEDKTRAVLFVYGLNRAILSDYTTPIQLQGLDSTRSYKITELNRGKAEHSKVNGALVSGAALQTMGIPVKLDPEYDSAVFELVALP